MRCFIDNFSQYVNSPGNRLYRFLCCYDLCLQQLAESSSFSDISGAVQKDIEDGTAVFMRSYTD